MHERAARPGAMIQGDEEVLPPTVVLHAPARCGGIASEAVSRC